MAIFSTDLSNNLESANDLKQIKSYLYKLNENLEYMFNNLTPEDNNASGVPMIKQVTKDDGTATFEISNDAISMNVSEGVTEDDLKASKLTIKPKEVIIESGGTLEIKANSTFYVTSPNLVINASGATFSGALSAVNGTFNSLKTQTSSGNDLVELGQLGNAGTIKLWNRSSSTALQTTIGGGTLNTAVVNCDNLVAEYIEGAAENSSSYGGMDIGYALDDINDRLSALEEA